MINLFILLGLMPLALIGMYLMCQWFKYHAELRERDLYDDYEWDKFVARVREHNEKVDRQDRM